LIVKIHYTKRKQKERAIKEFIIKIIKHVII